MLIVLFHFFFLISFSQSIVIHTIKDQSENLVYYDSHYTTLGVPPNQTIQSPIVILSKHNFSGDCGFSHETNTSLLQGNIFIFYYYNYNEIIHVIYI